MQTFSKGHRITESDAWLRSLKGWHIAFAALLGLAAFSGATDSDLVRGDRILLEIVLAGLAISYVAVGAPALRSRATVSRHAYRVALVLALGVAAALQPDSSVLLFIAFPQLWMLSNEAWEGAVYSALLAVAVGVGFLSREHWSVGAAGQIGATMLVSLGVSLALGLWITRVIEQSFERATLIEELQSARDELAEAHHASGVLAERERMAGEIHDTLAQGFTSIVMLAQTAQAELRRSRVDQASARLASIEETARDNLDEARALVAAFAPAALEGATLVEALERLTVRFGAETGLAVNAEFKPSRKSVAALHPSRQVVLLRAAQESLTNIRKHAGAHAVSLRVVVDDDETGAVIEVIDDGVGFEPTEQSSSGSGYGLSGMRGRVEQVGGTVDVRSAPGSGTSVRVTVPAGAL